MKSIVLSSILPQVFAGRKQGTGDVWLQNLTLERGKFYLIEASSGTGKTSLCSYLTGYRDDYSGNILFDEQDIKQLKVADWSRIRQKHLSHLFQELRLFPELTAFENVQIKNELTGFKTRKEILDMFDLLGIADKVNKEIGRMSFGQQQRVALIRALCQPFDFLLADEPVSHLDEKNSSLVGQLMMQEATLQGAGIVLTSIGKHVELPYERRLVL